MEPSELQPLTGPGTPFYYQHRHLDAGLRQGCAALFSWRHALDKLWLHTREPEIAQAQLLWWMEEIQRMFAGKPRHPLTQLLTEVDARHGLPQAHFAQILQLMHDRIQNIFPDRASLLAHCHDIGTPFELLYNRVLRTELGPGVAERLGTAMEFGGWILTTADQTRIGRTALTPDETAGFTPDRQLGELMQDRVDVALALVDKAMEQRPSGPRERCLPFVARIITLRATLRLARRRGPRILQTSLQLTPLRLLWLSLRSRRLA